EAHESVCVGGTPDAALGGEEVAQGIAVVGGQGELSDVRGDAGQDVITGEEHVAVGQVQAQVPGGVARCPHGAQVTSGKVDHGAVLEFPVGYGRSRERVDEEQCLHVLLGKARAAQLGRHDRPALFHGPVTEVLQDRDVGGVHGDPGAGGLAQTASQARVVGVEVGEDG